MVQFLVYDVFTDRPFGGNQLAIIPDARGLDDARMLDITREFNFSETVFLSPPEDPAHTARVRIFTVTGEIPFAGHPTIGTAVMLAEAGVGPEMVLGLGIGPIRARATPGEAQFTTTQPLERRGPVDAELIAACLSLDQTGAGPVLTAPELAPETASVGLPFTIAHLDSRAALAAASPDTAAFRAAAAAHPETEGFHLLAVFVEGDVVHARMFAPLLGVAEDPATGSAAAAFGALCHARRREPVRLMIHQGDDMGRPSRIGVTAGRDGVTISGQAVRVMEGSLSL